MPHINRKNIKREYIEIKKDLFRLYENAMSLKNEQFEYDLKNIEDNIFKIDNPYLTKIWIDCKLSKFRNEEVLMILGYINYEISNEFLLIKKDDIDADYVSAIVAQKFMEKGSIQLFSGIVTAAFIISAGFFIYGTFKINEDISLADKTMEQSIKDYNSKVIVANQDIGVKISSSVKEINDITAKANSIIEGKAVEFGVNLEDQRNKIISSVISRVNNLSKIEDFENKINISKNKITAMDIKVKSEEDAINKDLTELNSRIDKLNSSLSSVEALIIDYGKNDDTNPVCIEGSESKICYLVQLYLSSNNYLISSNFKRFGDQLTIDAIKAYQAEKSLTTSGVLTMADARLLIGDQIKKAARTTAVVNAGATTQPTQPQPLLVVEPQPFPTPTATGTR